MASQILLYDHPVSSYAQKVRIALREKNIPFKSQLPAGIGSGKDPDPSFLAANPRLEVPTLVDGDVKIFDSKVILGYLEDRYPEHPLLPKIDGTGAERSKAAVQRAQARMIEELCDTAYEAINWAWLEMDTFERAAVKSGLKEKLETQVRTQTETVFEWLDGKLGDQEWFGGKDFGYADVCVAPVFNRSMHFGFGPPEKTALGQWYKRLRQREAVKATFEEMENAVGKMAAIKGVFKPGGGGRREYRDHRLEWMVKSGGIDIVLAGLKDDTIRFGWPNPSSML